jgi:transposase-like protein
VFLGLAPASSEGHDPWGDVLADLSARGLRSPVLVISDGAPGLLSAVEQAFPAALRQRCLVHRARNVLAKVPVAAQAQVKAAYWSIFDDIDQPAGQAAVEQATRRAEAFAAQYQRTYPAAVACLTSTLGELTAHLRFPREHWQRIRHTNLLERTFGRPAGGPRSSGGFPVSGPASSWSGPSLTAPAAAGAG